MKFRLGWQRKLLTPTAEHAKFGKKASEGRGSVSPMPGAGVLRQRAIRLCFEQKLEHALNRERFVDAIRITVQDSAVTGTISLLSRPPGRRPKEELVALSKWFNSLSFQDRQNVERVIEMTAQGAVFRILCVLDGAAAIENGQDKGTLDLRYRRDDINISLNDEAGAPLHELL